ncbi:hypothetical protein CLH62_14615 [Marinobacter guineae]|uniref:Uncharacterized protein n=1 Tax=Marinobacter guineae TaxID=432303 RepID=A0A2G1VBR0_9GAMM|nr:hypothetical protein [Marinobacter guineae]PHQ24164.1 hypothetical protein CLH62_14615 [Marinobacter guineae]
MTSDEFAKRFQSHPLGWNFQNLETTESIENLEKTVSITEGILFLLEYQGDITETEYEFLREALQGNAQRNIRRIEKTNSSGTKTRQ